MTDTVPDQQILTITQLNRRARQLLETHLSLVWVRGEISNLARPGSGHWYFTLKDRDAQIRCAMFRNRNSLVSPPPREGDQVLVRGRVSLYENRGDYQLIAEHMEPDGLGKLQQQFEALKNRLAGEGLFDNAHKRPLPAYPQQIGVITSPTGAAIRDILHVLARRAPWIPITLYPTAVQGKQATAEIISAIELANDHGLCDVLILGRGGGSLEDLWAFNEEAVAMAIYNSAIPIVSAVGHETDFTIADFIADLRAPTPSAAAELVSPDRKTLDGNLLYYRDALAHHLRQRLVREQIQVEHLRKRLRNPADQLREQTQHLDHLDIRLNRATASLLRHKQEQYFKARQSLASTSPARQVEQQQGRLLTLEDRMIYSLRRHTQQQREKLATLSATLNAVSPLATLERGYAIARGSRGEIIRSVTGVEPGQSVDVVVEDGRLLCTVDATSGDRGL